jgi:transposase
VISTGSMRHDSICPFGCEAGMTVQITRRDHDAASLREHASRACEASVVRRLLALALVLEGHSRVEAAKTCGMDRQTLRDWVHRYNEQGIDGLSDRPHGGGAPPKLTVEEKTQLAAWVRQGPNVAEDGVVRWRLRDLRDRILARFFVPMDERSVGRILKTLTFSHISVRPRHPQADAAAQEAHKKTSPTWSQPRFPLPHRVSRSSCGGRTKRGLASKAA